MIKPNALLLLFLFVMTGAWAVSPDELLPPDEAFQFLGAEPLDPGRVEVRWKIADGYYLYRDKIKFKAPEGIELGRPELPKGETKQDELFGQVEVYRHNLRVELPVKQVGSLPILELQVKYQGCADLGVCYPPQKKSLKITLPANVASAAAATATTSPEAPPIAAESSPPKKKGPIEILSGLRDDLAGGPEQEELLPPEQAFAFDAVIESPNRIVGDWMIAEGYYLYKDKIKVSIETPDGVTVKAGAFPPGEMKADPQYGKVEVFRGPLSVPFELQGLTQRPQSMTAVFKFQGCADLGVCYPPQTKRISFDKNQLALLQPDLSATPSPAAPAVGAVTQANSTAAAAQRVSEQDAIAAQLASGNVLLTLASFFGFGLLLALTPCVFPMIPILSGIIVGQGERLSTTHAFMLSLVYVLAMAVVYAIVGVIAGLTGANLQIWFQNPVVLVSFAAIFVALSLSMFGFYELQMPAAIQSKLTEVSNKQRGGNLLSAGIMGVLSALIVGPCVTAPLMGALIFISQTGSAVIGGLALFAMGLGMGAPLLLIGLSAGKLLPKAGAWMDAVKAVFGVMLLGVAIWFLDRVLPASLTLLLWALLFILSGSYMLTTDESKTQLHQWRPAWRGLGITAVAYGILMLVGVAIGGGTALQPLKGLTLGSGGATLSAPATKLDFRLVSDLPSLQQALASARAAGRPVMLDFTADWCVSCEEMEHITFADPRVSQALDGVVLLRADVTENNAQDQELLKHFGLIGPPAILYWTAEGAEQKGYRLVGFSPPEAFIEHSRKALQLPYD